jgi:predicted dehydrogenase
MAGVQLGYYERNLGRGESFRQNWDARLCESFATLLDWADVIDICLPTDVHPEFALKAIAAGKPLFLEKPIARTLDEAISIVAAAKNADVPLMIGHVVRYFPEFALGRQMVLDGAVGKPAAVRTRRGGPAPKGSSGWFLDHSRSGGVLLDLAIHDFDWLQWTFGTVKFLYSRSLSAQTGKGPDYALTTLTFESGAVAHVEATWMDPGGFRTTFDVAGSEGLLEFDSRKTPALRTVRPESQSLEPSVAPHEDPYYQELSAFLNSAKSGAPVPITGEDGIAALKISLAALESARTGAVVSL